jgi:hypothetical protein
VRKDRVLLVGKGRVLLVGKRHGKQSVLGLGLVLGTCNAQQWNTDAETRALESLREKDATRWFY